MPAKTNERLNFNMLNPLQSQDTTKRTNGSAPYVRKTAPSAVGSNLDKGLLNAGVWARG